MRTNMMQLGMDCYKSCLQFGRAYGIGCCRSIKYFDLYQAHIGLVSAGLGLICLHAMLGHYGASLPVITALLFSTLCGVILGLILSNNVILRFSSLSKNQVLLSLCLLWLLALFVVNIRLVCVMNNEMIATFSRTINAGTWGMTLGLITPALLCWAIPLSLLIAEFSLLTAPKKLARLRWCGISCCIIPVTFFAYLGVLNTSLIILLICSLLVVYKLSQPGLKSNKIVELPVTAETLISNNSITFSYRNVMVLAGLFGAMTVAIRYYSNLILASEMLPYVELGCGLWGCALGMSYCSRRVHTFQPGMVGIAAPVLISLMLLIFPLLVHGILWSTTYLQLLPLIVLSKFMVVMAFYVPAGFLAGVCFSSIFPALNLKPGQLTSTGLKHFTIALLCLCLTIWMTRFVLIGQIGVARTFMFWSAWIIVWSVQPLSSLFSELGEKALRQAADQRGIKHRLIGPRIQLGFAWSVAGLVLLQPFILKVYQPENSAQLLFSGTSFSAYREQVNIRDIPQIEGNRPLLQMEGSSATLIAFTYRNAQIQLRKSGTPSSIVSRDPGICPHYSGDMLATILPLVIHNAPRNVCVLGAAGGASAKVVSAWPLHEATIFDPDNTFINKLGQQGIIPWYQTLSQQPNLKFNTCDLPLACWNMPYNQDVIVLNTDVSALASTAPCYAENYLKEVQTHLSDEGIFALRFNYTDYGQKPLQDMARTICKIYKEAIMFEAAPGEMVLLGSNVMDQLTSAVLVQNLQTSQARRIIAEIGWDWSIILNLSLYDHSALLKIASHSQKASSGQKESNEINHFSTDHLAFMHPIELYGWHHKHQQITQLLDKKSTRLIAKFEQHPLKDDILYRLSDIAAREKLQYDHPDEPWAYRKFAKERLQQRTRSEIITVKGEGLQKKIHSDDQRRLDYFESLGQLLQKTNPSMEDIRLLYRYKEPYDPVVSYFVHNEVARICARLEPAEQVEELRCRMHMIYYGSLNDRSVIDICKCLTLLTELLPGEITPAQRWEYANGLCEQLKIRWRARASGASVPPVIEISDLKESISAVKTAVDLFPAWGQAASIDQQVIESRIRMVDKLLIGSLQNYKLSRLKKLEESRNSVSESSTNKSEDNPIIGF